jgi:hypothetical protein
MPSRFQSKKYSTINDLLAGSVSIVIYFESALLFAVKHRPNLLTAKYRARRYFGSYRFSLLEAEK